MTAMAGYRLLPAGDTALVVEFGDRIDRELSGLVLALARRLDDARLDGLVECVPTFRSLMVHYEPLVLAYAVLAAHIATLMQGLQATGMRGRQWRLPVCYDPALAPDLAEVAERTGLSPAQVIERHSSVVYRVYMLGFLPGQPYLGDLPAELTLPRRQSPRTKIPAGSVAIATGLTSIFPQQTPCGWHLIGRCPLPLWGRGSLPLLQPGDQVGFAPVSRREFDELLPKAAGGALTLAPIDQAKDAAA
jgi:KipI family sensor histidine kinase inhibitor